MFPTFAMKRHCSQHPVLLVQSLVDIDAAVKTRMTLTVVVFVVAMTTGLDSVAVVDSEVIVVVGHAVAVVFSVDTQQSKSVV